MLAISNLLVISIYTFVSRRGPAKCLSGWVVERPPGRFLMLAGDLFGGDPTRPYFERPVSTKVEN